MIMIMTQEYYEIILHKNLRKVQVPKSDKYEQILTNYVISKFVTIQNSNCEMMPITSPPPTQLLSQHNTQIS